MTPIIVFGLNSTKPDVYMVSVSMILSLILMPMLLSMLQTFLVRMSKILFSDIESSNMRETWPLEKIQNTIIKRTDAEGNIFNYIKF